MSIFDYNESRDIAIVDYGFNALIMAALRKADSRNLNILRKAYPDLWNELIARYNAPGGILPDDVLPEDDDSFDDELTGGPDGEVDGNYTHPEQNPSYRESMIDAGRGHLLP